MTARAFRWAWAVLGMLSFLGVARGTAAAQEGPPKPGPEHALLKKMEGTWDTLVKASFGPGDPTVSKGIAVYKMECGGLWLTGDFRGTFAGMPFQGKSLETYDAGKKKYTNIWVDSWATQPMLLEGTYDKETKSLTMKADYPGPDGKPLKYTSVTVLKDDDTMLFTMSTPGKDGKDTVMMTITYTRKK